MRSAHHPVGGPLVEETGLQETQAPQQVETGYGPSGGWAATDETVRISRRNTMKKIIFALTAVLIAVSPSIAYACVTCPGYCANGYHSYQDSSGYTHYECD